jgi:Na+/melibiose symporter-like transporter
MLVAFSIVPAVVGVVGFALLIRYPLTRAYCNQLKDELAVQRARIHAENQA